jgi:AraC-like DNA-binding protein
MQQEARRARQSPPRGVLFAQRLGQGVDLEHFEPSEPLRPYVTRYWVGRWDLRGKEPFPQSVIPHPCVNIEVIRGVPAMVSGVRSKSGSVTLQGHGIIFGVKFAPGAFRPLFGKPVALLTDRSVPLASIFPAAEKWSAIPGLRSIEAMVARAESLLSPLVPKEIDPKLRRVTRIHDRIARDRSIVRVEAVAEIAKSSVRLVQQLFREWIGVSPKWVISRYRLQEAAERMANDRTTNAGDLAGELGYFDQAHFSRDFKRIVGMPPARYAALCRQPSA